MGARRWLAMATVVLASSVTTLVASVVATHEAGANTLAQGTMVDDDPVPFTPNVLNGYVTSITTVGERVIVGGTFTSVGEVGTWLTYSRNYLFAFDRTTGLLDQSFVPVLDGVVETVDAAPDGTSVFVGGNFSTVNGVPNFGIAKLDVTTGQMVPGFNAATAGKVRDLEVFGDKVYIGGDIWAVNGTPRKRLAAIDVTTGAVDPTFTVGPTQPRVSVDWVEELAVNQQGTELVIMGNFLAVEGLPRNQIARIDLTGPQATVMPWTTARFGNFCSASFWSYLKDVEYSLDGDYFVVVTTGGPNGTQLCDSASRWETSSQSATSLETWADWTGGDTLTAVAISDTAVYIGGHQRWMNNHLGANTPGSGAVVREGLAALDPLNGLPLTWNPGKHRGIGVWDLHLSDIGLYVGSDTDFTAGEWHAKLAQFPLTGGATVPVAVPDQLPTTLYTGTGTTLTERSFDGATFGTEATVAGNPISWTSVSDAFVEADKLYYVESSTLRSRTFDGTTFGPAVTEPSWTNWPNVTATAWDDGRLYYVQSNSTTLRYRYFSLESGFVGSQTFTVADGISWTNIAGMDVAGNRLYYSRTDGNLWVVDLVDGVPVNGTQQLLSGPGTGDGRNWNRPALFFRSTDEAPAVGFVAPTAGSVVSGSTPVTATALDDRGIAQVSFSAGATVLGVDTDGADGWSVPWDTTLATDGPVILTATATDTGGQTATATVTVTVDNLGPTLTIDTPLDATVVAGQLTVSATATDIVGVAQVAFAAGATPLGTDTDGADGWAAPWDTTVSTDGPVILTATATDTGGRTATATVTVTVDNLGPTVTIDAPLDGAVVSGPVAIAATATGTAGAAQVTFTAGALTIGTDTDGADGWSVVWDTTAAPDGPVTITATVADTGAQTGSASATVTVDNLGPTVAIVAPANATVVAGQQTVTATATDTLGVAQVAFAAGANPLGTDTDGADGWAAPWDTTLAADGPVILTATATDTGGRTSAATVTVTVDNVVDPPDPIVLMVVGNPAALGAGEVVVRDRLIGLGFAVTVVDDSAAVAADAVGTSFVLVTSTVNSNLVGATFRDVARPVWMAKPFLLDDMGMTGATAGTDYGNVFASTVTIAATAHPMAAGLTGTVPFTSPALDQSFGVPGPTATTITTAGGRATTFVYRSGVTLPGGLPAAGCRLTFPLFGTAPTSFTTQAFALFDAAVGYAAGGCPLVGDPEPDPDLDVVFVVANPASPTPGEIAVRDRLVGLGTVVTLVDDNTVTPATATGAELVVVSSSVASNVVGSTFRDVGVPVWMAKPYLLDDMGMTGTAAGADYGNAPAATVTIATPAHPMAAGLTGEVAVTTSVLEMSFGVPGAAATIVATAATRPASFVYRAGDVLANGSPAAACRLTSSIFQNAPTAHTAAGWALFDAAAQYALLGCPAVPPA